MLLPMNARNELAEPAPGESLCGHCGRRWFGLVAYCPYCGRQSSLATQDPGDHPDRKEALASAPATLEVPAVALPDPEPEPQAPTTALDPESVERPRSQEASASESTAPLPAGVVRDQPDAKPPAKELRGTPVPGGARSGDNIPFELNGPAPSKSTMIAWTLLFMALAAGVIAVLLFWIGSKLLAPGPKPPAALSGPRATSGGVVSPTPTQGPVQGPPPGRAQGPTQGPSTGAAPAPTRAVPPPTPAPAPAPTRATPPPTAAPAPAPTRAAPPPTPAPAPAARPGATQAPPAGPSKGAAPAPPSPPRSDRAVPRPSTRSPLCSAADEAAGLCKSP